jgi:peptide/nickel transport system permease protein
MKINKIRNKIAYFSSVILGLVLVVFLLFQALPGPEQILSGQRTDKATTDAIVRDLGLDQPTWKQALLYINDISVISVYPEDRIPEFVKGKFLNLGNYAIGIKFPYLRTSFQTKLPVNNLLGEAFIGTVLLTFAAMFLALILGIPLGVWAASRKDSRWDRGIVALSTLGISVPSFFSAMLFSWLFGFVYREYTGLPMTGSWLELNSDGSDRIMKLSHLILPALALGIRPLAVFIQLTRNTMVDVLVLDFIKTAQAKGVSYKKVIWKHAFPNALNPIVTSIGGWFSSLLAGSFFTEYIFQWKGMGKVSIEALQQSDFPVVMGAVLLTACLFFIIHQFTEWLYVWIDPRLKHG